MKPILSGSEQNRLNHAVAAAEKKTGCQIVLAVIRRSDAYPEIPWKAFAMAASVSGLAVFAAESLSKTWPEPVTPPAAMSVVLGTGIVIALLSLLVPPFARFFLGKRRARSEVRQYAESFFLRRELSATAGRRGVLLLVSLFERRVILLPDKGLRSRLTAEESRSVIDPMIPILKRGDVSGALKTGLDSLTLALLTPPKRKQARSGRNELPDSVIEEEGA
ncbi:TPM domain-containing protein [bacterium]|nr:TPM domain-containing protein [bacterium]